MHQYAGMKVAARVAAEVAAGAVQAATIAFHDPHDPCYDPCKELEDILEPKAPPLQILAIDTPGVEDSEGEDDENTEKVIDAVLENRYLSSIVMVTKIGHPITHTWKVQVERYYKLFPMMASQWIFVHTNADPYARNSMARVDTSSFERHCQETQAAVNKVMVEVTGDHEFDAAHLFVESNVVDEPLKAVLAFEHNVLYNLIANFDPVRIDSLAYEKGPILRGIDNELRGALSAAIIATTQTLQESNEELGRLFALKDEHMKQRQQAVSDISSLTIQKDEIDHNGNVDTIAYVDAPWRFFHYPRASATLYTKHPRYEVSIIDTTGYETKGLKQDVDGIRVEEAPGGLYKLKVHVVYKYILYPLRGKIVVSSKSRDVHADKILDLKVRIAAAKEALQVLAATQELEEANLNLKTEARDQTKMRFKTAGMMRSFLNETWDCATYRQMKPFYAEAKARLGKSWNSTDLLKHFQEAWLAVHKEAIAEMDDFTPVPLIQQCPGKDDET
eukprot:TRINITY_DN8621_c0_g1_i6.p1 TRINITY_DN8621_c0_g1~~TRINITY_DN8621_c0_g1_i6.p1  ORF type:complete len:503 (+),score=87.80 TRINITY_DN8621_c0_g1_i6:1359-2867(+)